jgi:hypothetical protein
MTNALTPKRRTASAASFLIFSLVFCLVWTPMLGGCAYDEPLPQPRKVIDPSAIQGSTQTQQWDLAAIRYAYLGQGIDYGQAGLTPVLVVVKNKSNAKPVINPKETRAQGTDGEYLPYSVDEALRLVLHSEQFSHTATKAGERAAVGVVIGAGLGALFGLIGGGDAAWKGAAVGAGVGGVGGAGSAVLGDDNSFQKAVERDLYQYAWTDEAIPPHYTKVGYVYFPGGHDITSVSVVLRNGNDMATYRLRLFDLQEHPDVNPDANSVKFH